MVAFRRPRFNFSLQRAVDWAVNLQKPLVILEALRCNYPWASDRFHKFILEGMHDNKKYFERKDVFYYPYVESRPDSGKGLLQNLSKKACLIITDDYPCFFIPEMIRKTASKIPILMEKVDSNGILPMRVADRIFTTAYSFRRFLQKKLPEHLLEFPKIEPLKKVDMPMLKRIPKEIIRHWLFADTDMLKGNIKLIQSLPIDHHVTPTNQKGGTGKSRRLLRQFLENRLPMYAEKRNEPENNLTSGLSPYIHFGHISVHEILQNLLKNEAWFYDSLSQKSTGSKTGWWGVGESAEAFIDQLVTWRELGFNRCWQQNDYDQYHSLPEWAQTTLKNHSMDKREYIYSLEEFESGQTHDPLWNAAQMQLVRDGIIHNYLRMLWGKKILEWTPKPSIALKIMIELNNKYALDGRDPNSYSGIFWILGRYDRAWGPIRPVFGKVRYMSSQNTARKVRVKDYIKKYAP
jgi:deoxyribodipyrimidine photo-lyase